MEKYKISVACIIEFQEKFLMVKEEQNGKISWDIPAGGIELRETLDQAILREIKEETGFKIAKPELKEILIFQEEQRTTVNFLYYIHIEGKGDKPTHDIDVDTIQVKWSSKEGIQELIDKNEYEHVMAKKRLTFILNGFSKDLTVSDVSYND